MVTKYMLAGIELGYTPTQKIIREWGNKLEDIWVNVKRKKQKVSHCEDLLNATKLAGEYKTIFLIQITNTVEVKYIIVPENVLLIWPCLVQITVHQTERRINDEVNF